VYDPSSRLATSTFFDRYSDIFPGCWVPNMQQDATTQLRKTLGSEEKLIQELLELQKCRIANRDIRRGYDLRFLRMTGAALDNLGVDNDHNRRVMELFLTEYGDCQDETSYVDVSYCREAHPGC
jgi:hypothetical protein